MPNVHFTADCLPYTIRTKAHDLTNQRFGQLVAKRVVGKWFAPTSAGHYALLWECVCDCGQITFSRSAFLKNGQSVNCGNHSGREWHGETTDRRFSREYSAWMNIKSRCFNTRHPSYQAYGARGVTLHPKWKRSFSAFLKDVGRAPSGEHSLDRINNDGHYEPGNVRWATMKEQLRNTRQNRLLTINGETKTLIEWTEISGIGYSTAAARLAKGWTHYDAIYSPVSFRRYRFRHHADPPLAPTRVVK